ncbi:hypothetical protein Ntsu_26180 [Nocardia sp. IFM 10818]
MSAAGPGSATATPVVNAAAMNAAAVTTAARRGERRILFISSCSLERECYGHTVNGIGCRTTSCDQLRQTLELICRKFAVCTVTPREESPAAEQERPVAAGKN